MSDSLARIEALRRGVTEEQADEQRLRGLGKETVSAVRLRQYAAITAGLRDGLSLAVMLGATGISAEAWPQVQAQWEQRLLSDLAGDASLAEALEFHRGEALLMWSRPLPPIDRDLRAWLDFERAHMLAIDEQEFLRQLSMTRNDLTRLSALWRRKLIDPALQTQAVEILNDPPGECPDVAAEPASVPADGAPKLLVGNA